MIAAVKANGSSLLKAALLIGSASGPAGFASEPPNLLVIYTDDQGYGDIGVNGLETVSTPHMDSIAENGIRCTRAYASPICGPSRAGLLTGIYPSRFGNEFNPGRSKHLASYYTGLRSEIYTIGERLQRLGYRTGWVGKWHLGCADNPVFHASNQGFDEWYDHEKGRKKLPPYDIFRNGKKVKATRHATLEMSDDGEQFIRNHAGEPWFLYYAPHTLHVIIKATDEYRDRVPNSITDPKRREYLASLLMEDHGIGKLLTALKETGQEENTLIVFMSDNGGSPSTGASNAPLRGHKGETFEGGIHVPCFIQWKSRLPKGKIYDRPIAQIDILPTALAAAGRPLPHPEAAAGTPTEKDQVDGVNLLPYLLGEKQGDPHEMLFFRFGEQFALIQGDWKLVAAAGAGAGAAGSQRLVSYHQLDPHKAWLINLEKDSAESADVSRQYPEKFNEMADIWARLNYEMPEPAFAYTGGGRFLSPAERNKEQGGE